MSLIPLAEILQSAQRSNYAVGAFNINGLLWAQAILRAAEEQRSPVILSAADRLIEYLGGFRTINAVVRSLIAEMKIGVPVALHLDHGSSVERCISAVEAGFSSVMYDGSQLPIEQNIRNSAAVVAYAHARNVSVEAEVGSVGGIEDGIASRVSYADPEECERMVREAGIDALAAALGSVHGWYRGELRFGFDEMKIVARRTGIPLVLHGASGVPEPQLRRTIECGHRKINFNTELNVVWREAVHAAMCCDATVYEPRLLLMPGASAITAKVQNLMVLLGSSGRA